MNIVFVDDSFITNLNRDYIHKNSTTDVISFVLEEDSEKKNLEGEVYVNPEQAKRQAQEYDVSWQNELFRVIIHGVLHLVGYDDQNSLDKKDMTKKENYYLILMKQ